MKSTNETKEKAWNYIKNQKYNEAELIYKNIIAKEPDVNDISNFGAILRKQGKLKEAIKLYIEWINEFPGEKNLTINAVNCAIEAGRIELGEKWIEIATRKHPTDMDILNAQARVWQVIGKYKEAIGLLEDMKTKDSENIKTRLALGIAQHESGLRKEALENFEWLHKKEPQNARHIVNLVTVMQEDGQGNKAMEIIRSLEHKEREDKSIRAAYAFLLLKNGIMPEAYEEFKKLCYQEPTEALHWLNQCAALRSMKRSMEAQRVIKKGIAINPEKRLLYHALSQCLTETGKPEKAAKIIVKEINQRNKLSDEQHFNIQFLGQGYKVIQESSLIEQAKRWEELKRKEGNGPLYGDRIKENIKERKVRIGYLSADFCNHPVGRFIKPILENCNRKRFEVVGISSNSEKDDIQNQLIKNCDMWLEIGNLNDIEAARKISDLKLDVLVELGGYTAGSRIGILCHRPTPVQLSYLGYFAPTYLECIDGWIGDKILFNKLTEGQKQAHKLIEIKGGYMCYQEKNLPKIKADHKGKFKFGCFNHARKLSADSIKLFCNVIRSNKNTALVLKSISFIEEEERERIRREFLEQGLNEKQLEILPWVKGRENHLKSYSKIDVALDPFPYGGATTTCESLIMGVPVISLRGEGMVGNLSASILEYGDCKKWIANNEQKYIEISKELANRGERKITERNQLRNQIIRSRLGDGKRISYEIEQAYLEEVNISVNADSR